MDIKQSEFITSAVSPNQYPIDDKPEIAFIGRSNVGKSSIINSITNRRSLAKVSSSPGKTKLVNFFLINNSFYLVDLPGYGYAKVSKSIKESFGKIIENYLLNRKQLKTVVLLVDSRHKPTNDDILMCKWIKHYGKSTLIVATKKDKLKKSEVSKSENLIRNTLELSKEEKIMFFSSLNKEGRDEILEVLFNIIEENQM